ncbi:MAG: carbohydrate-binding family 9-like protein [Bryobacteraceae bacterium]
MHTKIGGVLRCLILAGITVALAAGQTSEPCQVKQPTAAYSIPRRNPPKTLSLDPRAPMWRKVPAAWILEDCTRTLDYPDLRTEVKAFWTGTDIYFLFACPYRTLNLFFPSATDSARRGIWDRDVVEIFLGDDWENIRHYREFEIAPTGDWIDLAIDLDRRGQNRDWRSGWEHRARIDEKSKTWYAACRIPLASVTAAEVKVGTRWRANLYRIDGEGPDSQRRFLCWQPTCVLNRDPNHVPENFGTLIFTK